MLDVSVKQLSPLEQELRFVIGRGEVDTEIEKFCNEIKKQVQVDGFRKGNVPVSVIKNRFADVIKAEVSTRLVHRTTDEAVKARNLKVAGSPTLIEEFRTTTAKKWLGDFKMDGGFVYAVTLETEPQIDIKDYTGLVVDVDIPTTDEWVNQRVSELQIEFAARTQVDRPAQNGDEVVIDYTGHINGELVPDGTETMRTAHLGRMELPIELESAIVGKRPEDEFECSIQFSDNYPTERIAGHKVDFHIKLHTITEVVPHPVDNDLAQKAVFESTDQMISEFRAKADEEFEKPRKAKLLDAIMTEILSRHPFPVPKSWVDNEMKVIAYRIGLKELPVNPDELNHLREAAHRSAQQAFILDNVYAKEPDIKLTPEEIEAILTSEGAKIGKSATEALGLLKNAGTYEGFVSFYEQQKAVDFLIKNTTIKERGQK